MGRNKFIQFLTKMEINQMNFNKRKITFDEFKRIFANDIAFYSRRIETKVIIELAELANESVGHKELSNIAFDKIREHRSEVVDELNEIGFLETDDCEDELEDY